jgi:hypothetical protein
MSSASSRRSIIEKCNGFLKCPLCSEITPCSVDDLDEYMDLGMPICCNTPMSAFAGQSRSMKASDGRMLKAQADSAAD